MSGEVASGSWRGSLGSAEPTWGGRLLAIWGILRVPGLLIFLYLSKDWILASIGDPYYITVRTIEIGATPYVRFLLFLLMGVVLTALWAGSRQLGELRGYSIAVVLGAAFIVVTYTAVGSRRSLALLAIVLLATNLLPDGLLVRFLPARKYGGAVMTLAAGLGELFFFRRYVTWLAELWTGRPLKSVSWPIAVLPAILLSSGVAVIFMRSPQLVAMEQSLRLPSEARIFARGDFNWIELDATRQHLFATGHGVPRILRYDLSDLDRPPLESPVDTGEAQSFAYEPAAGEIYVYNLVTKQLLILDVGTLELKRSIALPEVATGDAWIVVDRKTNTIMIVSEADELVGSAFMVIDRSTGEVRDRRNLDAGNVLLVPETSRVLLSFFRRRNELMSYDLEKLDVLAQVTAPPNVDRMVYEERSNEVLLVAPVESQILRYDADTLSSKGAINLMFGVRAVAVDKDRHILLAGSLVTGEIAFVDLITYRVLSRVYLGPWLRTIQVDSASGIAYVSSEGALYELKYGHLN